MNNILRLPFSLHMLWQLICCCKTKVNHLRLVSYVKWKFSDAILILTWLFQSFLISFFTRTFYDFLSFIRLRRTTLKRHVFFTFSVRNKIILRIVNRFGFGIWMLVIISIWTWNWVERELKRILVSWELKRTLISENLNSKLPFLKRFIFILTNYR